MLPIVVMLWRLYITRKRKLLLTILELGFPILVFVSYILIKQMVSRGMRGVKADPQAYPVYAAPLRVCYSPDTNLTRALMDEAGRRLFLNRLDHAPEEVEEGFAPVPDFKSMKKFSERMEVGDAIVEFQDMHGSVFPKELNYTVRMKSGLRAQNLLKIVIGNGQPLNQFDTIYEPFVRLQWALDTSFLQVSTGTNINPTLSLEAVERTDSTGTYIPLRNNPHALLECTIILLVTKMAIFVPLIFFIMRFADEKNSGIEELLKLSSMSTVTLYGLHYINMIPGVLVYCISGAVCFKLGARPALPATSPYLIALVLFLQMWSVIAVGAFVTSLFVPKRPFPFALAVYAITTIVIPIGVNQLENYVGKQITYVLILVPMAPSEWIFEGIGMFELFEIGARFGPVPDFIAAEGDAPFLNIGWCCAVMGLQIGFYFLLGVWMTRIIPGPYGQTQDASIFSCLKKKAPSVPVGEVVQSTKPDPQYFEELPSNLPVGIRIKHVTKVFPRHVALTDLTLDVLKGEITLLLGHNGAGKTTILNIITGMFTPTSGKVEINGIDVVEKPSAAYRIVGLCPQHNLFFPDLTVMEHVMVFALLKGFTKKNAKNSSGVIIKQLGLETKTNNFPSTLSGGMKRRVQLACALAGDSSVLILDEPTSGLDVETRRGLWDLLLSLRGDRTVLLTTHFMEEADALGDRVAALHSGYLKCHATPMFLKNAVGGGYRLSVTMKDGNNDGAITELIRKSVPNASVCDKSHKLVIYNVPSTDSASFPKLFSELEEKKESLGIVSIGVGKSTLDEVFIRLCSDVVTHFEEVKFEAEPEVKKVTGIGLYFRMWIVLMHRHLRFVRVNIFSYVIVHVIFPVALAFCAGWIITKDVSALLGPGGTKSMKSDLIHNMNYKHVMLRGNHRPTYHILSGSNEALPKLGYTYVESSRLMTPATDLIRRSNKNDILIDVECNDTHAKAKYSVYARHAAPVAVNLLSNLLARRWLGETGSSISVLNQPIDVDYDMYTDANTAKSNAVLVLYAIIIAIQFLEITNFAITLASKELTTGTRHIHQMCGCPLTLYWGITLGFHLTAVLCFGIVPDIIALYMFENDNILTQPGFWLSSSLIGLLGILAFIELYFFASVIFSESVATLTANALFVAGICTAAVQVHSGPSAVLDIIHFFSPITNMVLGVCRCGITANLNAKCKMLHKKCPNLNTHDYAFDEERCCESSGNYESYFRLDDDSAGKELLFLCFQTCLYMWLLLMADSGVFSNLKEKWTRCKINEKSRFIDSSVAAERTHVANAIRKPRKEVEDALLCYDVHKNYRSCCKDFMAVNGLNISVKRRECYGLLGINGAGKSTTFKMIIAETYPTHGYLVSNGYYISEKMAYMQTFSYCPQFFGLDDFLTGEQNLILVLTLRGLSAADAKAQAASWLSEIGLTQYAHQCVSGYSGGCARRLAAVAALCQHSHIALLDEPTTGVDTAARRRVHAAVLRAKQSKSVVIASHSMDEIEALCDRICIMSAGEVAALGSAAELRQRHATGFSAVFKLSAPSAVVVADRGTMVLEEDEDKKAAKAAQAGKSDQGDKSPPLPEHPKKRSFMEQMQATFDCRVVDDHRTMCHIHINDLMPYSKLFGMIEDMKKNYSDLIEDYVVAETTLEEVFIGIAKEGQEYVESQKKAKEQAKNAKAQAKKAKAQAKKAKAQAK